MKKILSLVLILALVFTMAAPFGVSAASHSDLFEYLHEKEVNPYMFSGTFQAFLSFENMDNGYALRNSEESDMVCEEIATFLGSYGVTKEEIEPYVNDFFVYFSDKPDYFKVFMAFVINTENIILPFTKQSDMVSITPEITDIIRNDFYSETLFLNILSKISEKYQDATSKMALKLVDERLTFMSDVADYIDFLESDDSSCAAQTVSMVSNTIDIINDGIIEEKLNFADYLVLIGILSVEMDDTTKDDDPLSTVKYNELAKNYKNGAEGIDEFYVISDIIDEYSAKISDATTQYEKNKLIGEAMTKATTVRVISSDVTENEKAVIDISDEQLIEFAAICGKKVRSELIKKGISVSKNQSYSLVVEFDESVPTKGFSVSIPYSSLENLEEKNISSVHINSVNGSFVINITTFTEKELVSGRTVTFALMTGKAEDIIAGLEIYAQGSNVINVSLSGDSECTENIPYGAMRFEKNVSGSEAEYGENNIYSVADNGDREKVSRYSIVDGVISFEIGEGRNFVKIDGELTKPNPEVTPTPDTDKKPSQNTGGSVWVDDGDNNSDSSDNNNITNPGQNTPNDTDKEQNGEDAEIKPPVSKPEVNFDDVNDSHWAKDYIADLAEKGILSGVGNNKFAPDANVTREQFAKILTIAFDIVNENAICEFSDVDSDSWYSVYVASAYEKGIINGIGDGLFGTGQNISRQDMATMIVRAAKACNITLGDKSTYVYNDESHISEYAFDAVKILAGSGAISGYEDNSFRPKNPSTRAQVAKIVSEILKYKK